MDDLTELEQEDESSHVYSHSDGEDCGDLVMRGSQQAKASNQIALKKFEGKTD